MSPEPVLTIRSILGEGPVWNEDEQVLYWLDVFLPALNRFDPATGVNQATRLDQPIYAFALRAAGGAIGCFESGIGFIDLDGGAIDIIADPKTGRAVTTASAIGGAAFGPAPWPRIGRVRSAGFTASSRRGRSPKWKMASFSRMAWAGAPTTVQCISPISAGG
jgi:hypothetical protein